MLSKLKQQAGPEAPVNPGLFAFVLTEKRAAGQRRTGLCGTAGVAQGFSIGPWLLIVAFYAWAAWRLNGIGLMTDEYVHFPRIERLLHGDFALWDQYSAMLPGYHALVACALALSGADSLSAARLISILFGILAIGAFCCIRYRVDRNVDSLLVCQFALFPLAFPYIFLVYTDIASLAFVMGATAAAFARRHWIASILMVLAIAVRQNNVIWLGLLAAQAAAPFLHWSERRIKPTALAAEIWPYLPPAVAFLGFWIWNGSISAPNPQSVLNPDISIHLGNPLFLLFLAGMLMPLHVLWGLREAVCRCKQRPWLWLVPLILFSACWWGFAADHPLNAPASGYELFLRARLFSAIRGSLWLRLAFCFCVTAAGWGLASTRMPERLARGLVPVALLYLMTLWMIDVRYLLIPAALWLALRVPLTRWIERATCVYWLVLSYFLLGAIAVGTLFP